MRYTKNNNFIEVVECMSVEYGNAWFVESSIPLKELPIEFHEQIPMNDKAKGDKLKKLVSDWAASNGFVEA